jgi:hypothetical protein
LTQYGSAGSDDSDKEFKKEFKTLKKSKIKNEWPSLGFGCAM